MRVVNLSLNQLWMMISTPGTAEEAKWFSVVIVYVLCRLLCSHPHAVSDACGNRVCLCLYFLTDVFFPTKPSFYLILITEQNMPEMWLSPFLLEKLCIIVLGGWLLVSSFQNFGFIKSPFFVDVVSFWSDAGDGELVDHDFVLRYNF